MADGLSLDERDIKQIFTGYTVGSLDRLITELQTIGELVVKPIVSVWDDDENVPITNRVAVYNLAKKDNGYNGLIEILSDEYTLIQPRISMARVINAFKKLGVVKAGWKLEENIRGSATYLTILFDQMFVDPTGSDVFMGVQVSTRSDGTAAVFLEVFFWRKVCMNGAKSRRLVKAQRIEHKGGQDVVDKEVEEFLEKVKVGKDKLQELIRQSYDDTVDGERAWKLISKFPKNMQKKIMDEFVNGTNKDRYTLFNICTRMIEEESRTVEGRNTNLLAAEYVLHNIVPKKQKISEDEGESDE